MLDLKYAFRSLFKTPAFTIIAVLTLGLGIGANSAIFSVIDAVLLRPLPFPKPHELISVWSKVTNESDRETDSYPDFVDLRDQSQSLDSLTAYTQAATDERRPVRLVDLVENAGVYFRRHAHSGATRDECGSDNCAAA